MVICLVRKNTVRVLKGRMMVRLTGFFYGALLIVLSTACTDGFNDAAIDIEQLCSLSNVAFAKQDFGDLLSALEKQFDVTSGKMRVTKQGIFIPIKERFVEEQGYFVARPGVNIVSGKGTDPAFDRVKECIYRYRIKG